MNFYAFIPRLLNMSLTASVAIVFVLLLRLMLKKAPKVISYALWAVVLFRLLCPVSIESGFSLFGLMDAPTKGSTTLTTNIEYVPEDIVHTEHPAVALPIPGISNVINSTLPSGREQLVADPLEAPVAIATYVWLTGVLVMAVYSVISYRRLRQKLLTVSPLRDNIYLADEITSPFVMGLVRPKIYLPSEMEEREQAYIIRHEQHHIRRGDHIIKALAFLALSIHWFNPLVWVAFIYSSKDMEMSCDEAVVKKMGDGILADYTASLLSLATGKHIIAGMPLAFGEGDTKGRIRNLANWHKPAFWVVLISVVACITLAVGLLTNPAKDDSWIKATHGATSVELECNLTPPIRSYAIYEDIYENGELISSEAIIFDRFQEEGGATPRRTTLSLNAQPVNGEEGGFSGELSLYFEGVGSAHWTRKLPKNHYTGAVHVAAEIGNGIFSKQKVATEDNVTLLTILLSTDPEGKVVVKTQNNTLVQSNDTVVIYRLVTSVGGDAATHLFYGANANQTNTPGTIKAPSIPVTWTYSPMMSATWHSAFYFQFGFDYTHIKASCDQGELWNLHGEEQSHNTEMQFEAMRPVCWTPATSDSLAEKANVAFTVYDDETELYTGCIEITKTGEDGGRTSYEARLINAPNLYMLPTDSGTGAKIITVQTYDAMTSPDTVIWSDADLDHDGSNETIHVRPIYDGMAYELSVVKQDGAILWRTEAHTSHAGYNSLFVCTLDGVDYLLRYHPTMYQGDSSYVYQLFSFDTQGNIILDRKAEVYFDINWGSSMHREFNAAEIADFMDEVNDLLAHSKLLLSTDEALELIDPEHPQDIPWWLRDGTYCSGYVYDESKTLRDNLLELERFVNS